MKKYVFRVAGLLMAWVFVALPGTGRAATSPYKQRAIYAVQEFYLPWDGPGAALLNPAELSEGKSFDIRTGHYSTVSGKAGENFYQISGGLSGFSGGLSYLDRKSAIDGSNAVYLEYILVPTLAYKLNASTLSGIVLSLGAAMPVHGYKAFGVTSSKARSLNLGTHLIFPLAPGFGSLHGGLTLMDLFPEKVTLPDGGGSIQVSHLSSDFSLLWKNLGGMLDVFASLKAFNEIANEQDYNSKDGDGSGISKLMLHNFGLEVHPLSSLGIKVERTGNKFWTFGLTGNVPIGKAVHLELEGNLSHDRFLSAVDEGRGYLYSTSVALGL